MNQPRDPAAPDVQAAFCGVLVDEWARAGLTDAVVAPGSRSTPLVLALDADARVRVHVVLDERSAGFTALGLAIASGRPVVVGTTSGTASVELHPSVVEAFHSCVPVIAATCDRPPELHEVGAPQTVDQEFLFGRAVRWAVSPGVPDLGSIGSWRSLASRIFAEAAGSGGPAGPVHVNLAFREPLLGDQGLVDAPAGRAGGAPWHQVVRRSSAQLPGEIVELLSAHAGGRALVVAGAGAADPSAVLKAAAELGWPVLADPRSGCRIGRGPVISSADSLLRVPPIAGGWIPDIVVRAGAPWTSKVLSQWLAGLPESVPQILVDPRTRWADPERRSSHVVAADAGELLSAAAAVSGPVSRSAWLSSWTAAERAAQEIFERLLGPGSELELSEPAVARAVVAGAPVAARVIVSSSMPVRDVEWFGPAECDCQVLSNRGANGIDGVMSTAIGVALGGAPTVALVGDLAFLYDAGALLGVGSRDVSLRLVVVDNDGGGIFSFLPQASALPVDRFERYWGTPQGADLASVAGGYGVSAVAVKSRDQLDEFVAGAGKPGVRLAIVRSERDANVAVHERLDAAVAEAVAELSL